MEIGLKVTEQTTQGKTDRVLKRASATLEDDDHETVYDKELLNSFDDWFDYHSQLTKRLAYTHIHFKLQEGIKIQQVTTRLKRDLLSKRKAKMHFWYVQEDDSNTKKREENKKGPHYHMAVFFDSQNTGYKFFSVLLANYNKYLVQDGVARPYVGGKTYDGEYIGEYDMRNLEHQELGKEWGHWLCREKTKLAYGRINGHNRYPRITK